MQSESTPEQDAPDKSRGDARFDRLRESIRLFEDASALVADAQARATEAKGAMLAALHDVNDSGALGDRERQQIVRALYWNASYLETAAIGEAFGIGSGTVPGLAGPIRIGACDTCDGDLVAFNRTERTEILSRRGSWRRSCSTCRATSREAIRRQSDADHARTQERRQELHAMPYQQYLLSPEWQDLRRRMLRRARYRCQVCNRAGLELNVHHRTYERRGFEELADLVVLCRDCHALYHRRGLLPDEND